MKTLLDAGYPKNRIYHYYSDLYIEAAPFTTSIIEKWYEDNNLSMEALCKKFKDNLSGSMMYDCFFQYFTE